MLFNMICKNEQLIKNKYCKYIKSNWNKYQNEWYDWRLNYNEWIPEMHYKQSKVNTKNTPSKY